MARIRSVHPDITEDETLADVSDGAERTFTRLWTYLDDQGRGKDNIRLIKAAIYPLHDQKTPEVVDAHLWELVEHGLLLRYEVDGVAVIAAKADAWGRYQKPQRPKESRLPAPPDDYTPPEPPEQIALKDPEDAASRHESATRQRRDSDAAPTDAVRVHAGGEGRGRQERETGDARSATRHDTSTHDATRSDNETQSGAPPRPGALELVPPPAAAPPARTSTLSPPPSATGYSGDFEAWYQLYPRKRAKADAAKAWKRARATATWEQLHGGLERSIATWQAENTAPDKIPYPASWLNHRRWEDEPDTRLAASHKPATGVDQIKDVLARRQDRMTS